jgi:hypothetical protein
MIENYLELIDIEDIEFTNEYDNMVDIQIDIDESFCLSNGIISHNSALSTCLSGFSVTGRKYYGAFPLKGKPLNVRGEGLTKIKENEEIKNIISALGLEFGKKYTDTKDLRYGKVVIMTDADCIDGNSLILTKNGYKPIKDINYEDEVLTHTNEWKKIINIIETTKDKTIKITINNEDYIFGENHEIPVLRDNKIIVIKAKDILKTDKLLKKKF